jgi:hypothetical protein
MAQVGGVRIPFIVDTTDIPRSVREVEKELRRLKQTAAGTRIFVDGRQIAKLNEGAIIPLINNLGVIREKALQASVSLKEIGKAATTLRAGKDISDKLVHSLSQLTEVGPKTIRSIRAFKKLNAELAQIRAEAKTATTRMQILTKSMDTLSKRKMIGRAGQDQLLQFANKTAMAQIEKYRKAILRVQEAEAKGAPREEYRRLQRKANEQRQEAIRLLTIEYKRQKKVADAAASAHVPSLQKAVNKERQRAIRLLEKDAQLTREQINTLKQRMTLETSPRVGYAKRLELKYARDLDIRTRP